MRMMMLCKVRVCMATGLLFLYFLTLTTYAAGRPIPSLASSSYDHHHDVPNNNNDVIQHADEVVMEEGKTNVEESTCEGIEEEEECLMRRTLAAHTDYIYTQNHKP